eukprot:576120_1
MRYNSSAHLTLYVQEHCQNKEQKSTLKYAYFDDKAMNRVGSRSFAFTFIIKDKKHTFTASYSKLHELHQSLKKTEIFTIAFENAPSFPSNPSVIGHEECKDALLIYFKTLTSNIAVLKHELFQNGINVSKDLQQLLASIDENQPFDVTVTT